MILYDVIDKSNIIVTFSCFKRKRPDRIKKPVRSKFELLYNKKNFLKAQYILPY